MGHRHGRPCSYWGGPSSTATGITAPRTREISTQPGLFRSQKRVGRRPERLREPHQSSGLAWGQAVVVVRDEGAGEKRLVL